MQYRNFSFFWQEFFGLCRAERRSAHSGASAARPYRPLAGATRSPTRPLGMFGCGRRAALRYPSRGLRKGSRVPVLRGYIDESYDGGSAVPRLFSLSCLVGHDTVWPYFEWAWVDVLEWKNKQLRGQGRQEISRNHAADCNSSFGEFKGWSPDEKEEFSGKLLDVFRKCPVHIYGYSMPLQLLVQEFPETKPNPVGFAYVILLTMLMDEIGKNTLALYPKNVISLHHDHSDYDAALADQFAHMMNDPEFKYRGQFTSITPACWQRCVRLQPADLIAYENFKEGKRQEECGERRPSLKKLLDLDSLSGNAKGFNLQTIRELKTIVDRLDGIAKEILFKTARIRTRRTLDTKHSGRSDK